MNVPHGVWKGTFGHLLGMEYTMMKPGHAAASLRVRPEHCNPNGVCHGGAVFSFADDTMGGAVHPLSPAGCVPASAQVNIHFARSARADDVLVAEARVVSNGRRTALLECRVTDEQNRLVALLTASYLFVEERHRERHGEE